LLIDKYEKQMTFSKSPCCWNQEIKIDKEIIIPGQLNLNLFMFVGKNIPRGNRTLELV